MCSAKEQPTILKKILVRDLCMEKQIVYLLKHEKL